MSTLFLNFTREAYKYKEYRTILIIYFLLYVSKYIIWISLILDTVSLQLRMLAIV